MRYRGLPSYERHWCCPNCYTGNPPDYSHCQECRADIDGNLPDEEELQPCTPRNYLIRLSASFRNVYAKPVSC